MISDNKITKIAKLKLLHLRRGDILVIDYRVGVRKVTDLRCNSQTGNASLCLMKRH